MLLILGLVFGILFAMLYVSSTRYSSIPSLPAVTEDQAIEIMNADLRKRIGSDVLIHIYSRDGRDPAVSENPLPLIYYRQEDNLAYRINGTTHGIVGSCVPSVECFMGSKEEVLQSIDGRLVYFIDGSYSGGEKSAPAYYYIDAINGDIVWSYIGEDVYPELAK